MDRLAKRYHKLPSEILEEDVLEFNINLIVLFTALKEEQEGIQELMDRNRDSFMCPAVPLLLLRG